MEQGQLVEALVAIFPKGPTFDCRAMIEQALGITEVPVRVEPQATAPVQGRDEQALAELGMSPAEIEATLSPPHHLSGRPKSWFTSWENKLEAANTFAECMRIYGRTSWPSALDKALTCAQSVTECVDVYDVGAFRGIEEVVIACIRRAAEILEAEAGCKPVSA